MISRGLLILRESLEHDHSGPPIVIRCWAKHASFCLTLYRPFDESLSLGLEAKIVEQVCERYQAIQEIWAAFPGLARSAKPPAGRANVGPCFIQMSAQAICLNL